MTQEEQDKHRSQYRIEYVNPSVEKLNLSQEALEQSEQKKLITATIKVARPGYVPEGVELRAHISPEIFTANIPDSMVDQLQDDPDVVSIQTAGHLRSF
jgi:hypothetical protein